MDVKYTFCSSLTKPKNILFPSTKGTEVYVVTPSSPNNDAVCSCKGFIFNGKCKHIEDVELNRCTFMLKGSYEGDICPSCGSTLDTWKDEIEFV